MKQRFPVKKLPNGQAMLNLACGARTHPEWNNVDFGPYARLAQHPRIATLMRRCGLISDLRWQRLGSVDPTTRHWNLRKGIPYPASTFDVVYHAHFLEHLRRPHAAAFLKECQRVLKPGGVLRVVVPDLSYYFHQCSETVNDPVAHEQAIEFLIDQMVRDQATGPNEQKGALKFFEKLIRGGSERSGERHLWMYDAVSLKRLLVNLGFVDCTVQTCVTSRVPGWRAFLLDANGDGITYKPESLYMEAIRPAEV